MNSISAHVEYLLRKHDCVVLPGIGALLCNYVGAHFSAENTSLLLPPSRKLVFNGMLSESDGLLASSVARKEQIPYEAAVLKVRDEMELLLRQLDMDGELAFGRLGVFSRGAEGQIEFSASELPSVNGAFYGLLPVEVAELPVAGSGVASEQSVLHTAPVEVYDGNSAYRRKHWTAYASGIAAALALVVSCALFLMSPIRTGKDAQMASLVPVPVTEDIADGIYAEIDCDDSAGPDDSPLQELTGNDDAVPQVSIDADVDAPVVADNAAAPEDDANPTVRFEESDPYCVIVASFPDMAQARTYVDCHVGHRFGILEKDGKCRVYAATGSTYAQAYGQKADVTQDDAWVCRR